jgi:NAD(P)-dependent dehydrogenase (short-subunit alcohol dehydrogenase family)
MTATTPPPAAGGRQAVVVGASRGLGRGIARGFAEAGALVVAAARSGPAPAKLATTPARTSGPRWPMRPGRDGVSERLAVAILLGWAWVSSLAVGLLA